jgi:hypothetical protein
MPEQTESIATPRSLADSLQQRLYTAAEALLRQGLPPAEIECRVFDFLASDPQKLSDSLKVRRVRLFQAAMGLPGPLPRDEASRLAEAARMALLGPPDLEFERRVLLGHLLHNLVQAAHDAAEEFRRDGIAVTHENLRSAVMIAVVNARPRSTVVPWNLPDSVVEKTIPVAVEYFFAA